MSQAIIAPHRSKPPHIALVRPHPVVYAQGYGPAMAIVWRGRHAKASPNRMRAWPGRRFETHPD
jgi:hypothetical protein